MYMYQYVCVGGGGAADDRQCLRSHRRNRQLKIVYFYFVTSKVFKWAAYWKRNYASIIIL